jgi:hypothetical protein
MLYNLWVTINFLVYAVVAGRSFAEDGACTISIGNSPSRWDWDRLQDPAMIYGMRLDFPPLRFTAAYSSAKAQPKSASAAKAEFKEPRFGRAEARPSKMNRRYLRGWPNLGHSTTETSHG